MSQIIQTQEEEPNAEETHAPRILFPKTLETLKTETVADESGYTLLEKVALRNAWRVLKKNFRFHSHNFLLDFFTRNHHTVEFFRNPENYKFKISSFTRHSRSVLQVFGNIIEEGLDNAAFMNTILMVIVERHRRVKVKKNDVQLYCNDLQAYIQNVLRDVYSMTTKKAFKKTCDTIAMYHEDTPYVRKKATKFSFDLSSSKRSNSVSEREKSLAQLAEPDKN